MAAFCVFVSPLPFKVRRKLFRFLSESSIVAKVAYGLKISFMYEKYFTPSTLMLITLINQIRRNLVRGRASAHVPHHCGGRSRQVKLAWNTGYTLRDLVRRAQILVRVLPFPLTPTY